MPCYDPPITRREAARGHEIHAMGILKKLGIPISTGPEAVERLCRWCKDHTTRQIEKADAKWWWKDHQKHDLRRSALAKLTKAEIIALGVTDDDLD